MFGAGVVTRSLIQLLSHTQPRQKDNNTLFALLSMSMIRLIKGVAELFDQKSYSARMIMIETTTQLRKIHVRHRNK